MAQAGKNTAFLGKARPCSRARQVAADQLDCDRLLEDPVVTLGLDYGAHAAAGDLADDAVGADTFGDRIDYRKRTAEAVGRS